MDKNDLKGNSRLVVGKNLVLTCVILLSSAKIKENSLNKKIKHRKETRHFTQMYMFFQQLMIYLRVSKFLNFICFF